MYHNIGKKIKFLAKFIFAVMAFLAFAGSCPFIFDGNDEEILLGFIILIVGSLSAWISSWFMYGFGEIIDKLCCIEKNTRIRKPVNKNTSGESNQNEEQLVDNRPLLTSEKRSQLEALRMNNMITEEEYAKILSKHRVED